MTEFDKSKIVALIADEDVESPATLHPYEASMQRLIHDAAEGCLKSVEILIKVGAVSERR